VYFTPPETAQYYYANNDTAKAFPWDVVEEIFTIKKVELPITKVFGSEGSRVRNSPAFLSKVIATSVHILPIASLRGTMVFVV